MNVTAFTRLRIACPDLVSAMADYQVLLATPACWQGSVLLDGHHQPCSSAWFYLQNTVIELLELPQYPRAIVGLVLASDTIEPTGTDTYGTQTVSHQRLSGGFARHLWITLESSAFTAEYVASCNPSPVGQSVAVPRVDHVVLYTSSAQGCIDLFGEPGLAMRLALDQNKPEWGGRMLFFRSGKMTLEIIEPNAGLEGDDYFWGIAYQVSDIDGTCQHITHAGGVVSPPRAGRKPGTRVATLKSHDVGIATLLVEQPLTVK